MKRQQSINKLIKDDMRSTGNHHGYSLSNCEICWTCAFFIVEGEKCILSYKDVESRAPVDNVSAWVDYFKESVHIKKPEWFRCMWWKGYE